MPLSPNRNALNDFGQSQYFLVLQMYELIFGLKNYRIKKHPTDLLNQMVFMR
jgi:hypothetical protein